MSESVNKDWKAFPDLPEFVRNNSVEDLRRSVLSGKLPLNAFWGMTSLLNQAVHKGDVSFVEWLLEQGACPHGCPANNIGASIHMCYEKPEMLRVLLTYGAEIDSQNKTGHGKTILARSLDMNFANPQNFDVSGAKRIECIKIALEHGADPLECDDLGGTPLSRAQHSGVWEQLEPLFAQALEKPLRPFPVSRCFTNSLLSAPDDLWVSKVQDFLARSALMIVADYATLKLGTSLSLQAATMKGSGIGLETVLSLASTLDSTLIVSPASQGQLLEQSKTLKALEKKVLQASLKPSPRWVLRVEKAIDDFDFETYPAHSSPNSDRESQSAAVQISPAPLLLVHSPAFDPSLLLANVKCFGSGGCSGAKLLESIQIINHQIAGKLKIVSFVGTSVILRNEGVFSDVGSTKTYLKAILRTQCQFAYLMDENSSSGKKRQLAGIFRTLVRSPIIQLTWK